VYNYLGIHRSVKFLQAAIAQFVRPQFRFSSIICWKRAFSSFNFGVGRHEADCWCFCYERIALFFIKCFWHFETLPYSFGIRERSISTKLPRLKSFSVNLSYTSFQFVETASLCNLRPDTGFFHSFAYEIITENVVYH